MKVKIKSTGEIKKVADYATVTLDTCDNYGSPEQVPFEYVELIQESSDNTDWEQDRIIGNLKNDYQFACSVNKATANLLNSLTEEIRAFERMPWYKRMFYKFK